MLVVAGASGYAATLIAGLAGSVVSLDKDEKLTEMAQANFAALGLANAKAVTGPLEQGAPAEAPFDLIVVDGVSQGDFESLLKQLRADGRLVGIVADRPGARGGTATLVQRAGDHVSARGLFDASAGGLPAFGKPRCICFLTARRLGPCLCHLGRSV